MTTVLPLPDAPGWQPPPEMDAMEDVPGDLNDELIATDWWTDQLVERSGIPIFDVSFVSVGGGMGSFVLTHILRVAGAPKDSIRVLTVLDYPFRPTST